MVNSDSSSIDLPKMWIQIHLSFGKYTSEFILIT